ncbi:MAG: hypothetical protein ACK4I8_07325 [Armatimonadota bacterium]
MTLLFCPEEAAFVKLIIRQYLKRTGIEVVIRVLKQEMGLSKRIVRNGEGLKGWVALCLVGYLLCAGREGRYRQRRDGVRSELEVYLRNPTSLKNVPKVQDLPLFPESAIL